MKTTLSSKGQVVLPAAGRRRLGLRPGAELEVAVDSDRLVLTPKKPSSPTFRQGTSALSGLPVLEITGESPPLTTEQVGELLADFP